MNNEILYMKNGIMIDSYTMNHINKKEVRFSNLEEIISILDKQDDEFIEYIEVDLRGEIVRGFSGGKRITKISYINGELFTIAYDEFANYRKLITIYKNNGCFSRKHIVKDCYERTTKTFSELLSWSSKYENILDLLRGGSFDEKEEYYINKSYDEL